VVKLMRTKITFVVEAKGFSRSVVGRLFAKIYSKMMDRAIAMLVQEMNASRMQWRPNHPLQQALVNRALSFSVR
jgi:hypothetical protein